MDAVVTIVGSGKWNERRRLTLLPSSAFENSLPQVTFPIFVHLHQVCVPTVSY